MRMPTRFAAWLLSLAALNAIAQDKSTASPGVQGKGVAEVVRVTATVEAIDQATRTVTLKDSKGGLHTFVASDEVRNLAQVGKGDVVTLEYAAALAVRLAKSDSKVRERTVTEGVKRSEPGQMPGGAAVREVKVIASVEAIDAKAQKVTLRGPEHTATVKVQDAAMLKGVKKGDMVEAVYTEAVALKVEKGAKK